MQKVEFISNLEYTLLTFLLLTVYHLFIRHNIFKDCIDRNVLNLGYGWESRYILVVTRTSHIAGGEMCFRRLKGWRTLWSTLTRTQSEHLNYFEIKTGITFCFVYVKISLFLQYRTILFDYEMILFRVSHIGDEAWGAEAPPSYEFFRPPPLLKAMPLMEHPPTPPLKNEAPTIWKTTPPPPLKHETPFH